MSAAQILASGRRVLALEAEAVRISYRPGFRPDW